MPNTSAEVARELDVDFETEVPEEAKKHFKNVASNSPAPKEKFDEFIPTAGVLRDYFDYARPLTDAPEVWHVITGIAALGAALKNNVFVQFGPQKIYPNIWMILLAPTSFFRKSTVLSIARKVLGKVDEKLVLPNEFTPEALTDILQVSPQGVFVWSEFAGVLSNFERNYMMGTKEFLTEIYDSPPTYTRKLRNNEWTISDPSISILSASAFEWFNSKVKEGDIRGGFLARFLYVPATEKEKRLAIPPKPDQLLANRIVRSCHDIQLRNGEMNISEIKKRYTDWIFTHEDELERCESNADLLSGFYTRLSVYCLKFAMIIEMSQQPSELLISVDSLEKAINLTNWLKSNIRNLLDSEFSFSKDMANKQKVLKAIRKDDGIEYRRLLQNSNLLANDLKPILETLKQQGLIQRTNGFIKPANVSEIR